MEQPGRTATGLTVGLRSEVPGRSPEDIRFLLLNPPLTDPTTAYHSISYLVGAADAAGFTGHACVDVNVEALNYLAKPELVDGLLEEACHLREACEAKEWLSRREQLEYRTALKAVGLAAHSVAAALTVLRDPVQFYNYRRYREAAMILERWLELLSLRALPGLFNGFALRVRGPANLFHIGDVTDALYLSRVLSPFEPYLVGPFAECVGSCRWDLIGISVNYLSQLPFAVALSRRVRTLAPDSTIVLGGTEVTDAVKYQRRPGMVWELFDNADLIVPGEGESALLAILEAIRQGKPLTGSVHGVMAREGRDDDHPPPVVYENVGVLPSPRYDIWDWDAYWAPEPVILYSPTRGCYWNKCTFCDYGINTDRPTSPSRQRSPELVLKDLTEATRIGSAMYFAVDAMSPSYLRKLCTALVDSHLELAWSAELRLERHFPRHEMGDLLKQAGCVSIAFGYESGSQRILNLIDKGVDISEVPAVLAELARVDIGAQMMGFTDFPSETRDEALETYRFLLRNADLWTIAAIGTFVLTGGSIVAKRPDDFGITVQLPPEADDIVWHVRWAAKESSAGIAESPSVGETEKKLLQQQVMRFQHDRPFTGGVDAAHTILYFRQFGRRLVPEEAPTTGGDGELLVPTPYEVPFDLPTFVNVTDLEALHDEVDSEQGLRRADVERWFEEVQLVRRAPVPRPATVYLCGDTVIEHLPTQSRSVEYDALKQLILQGYGAV
jgi:anaerobic magnesium-protoporphyrin IX monomethyl ester cyclase